jgi:hypothetical protein
MQKHNDDDIKHFYDEISEKMDNHYFNNKSFFLLNHHFRVKKIQRK